METDNAVVGENSQTKPIFLGYRDSKTVAKIDPASIKKPTHHSSSSASSADEISDDNDEEEETSWKRKKKSHSSGTCVIDGGATFREMAMDFQDSRAKEALLASERTAYQGSADLSNKRRNNVWGNVLMEQSLSDTIYGVGVDHNRRDGNRDIESYEYWLKNRKEPEKSQTNIPPENIRKRKKAWPFHYQKDEPDEKFAKRLARRLNEPKYILIGNVVKCIGRKLAIELLYSTEEIEATGGIMTVDQSRRKTPGGVYLQLLKNHPNVTKEQLNIIFEEDRKQLEMQKKKSRKLKKNKRKKFLQNQMEKNDNMNVPQKEADISAMQASENGESTEKKMSGDKEPGEIDDDDDDDDITNDEIELPKITDLIFKHVASVETNENDSIEME